MTYEIAKFGNGVAVGSGGNVTSNVHTRYNTQLLGEQIGVNHSDNAETQVTMTITGTQLQRDAATGDGFLLAPTIPVGAVISDVIVQVKEAFVLGGTTPTINVGTQGSETTNGFPISAAQAGAIGTYTPTKAGTWAAPVAANILVGVALGGTGPTVTAAGRMDILIKYVRA